jgi:hypothetical protein
VSTPAAPTDTDRSNFFAKVAFADVIALVDFTLTFVSGAYIVYPSVWRAMAVILAVSAGSTKAAQQEWRGVTSSFVVRPQGLEP